MQSTDPTAAGEVAPLFDAKPTSIAGVLVIERRARCDARGEFTRLHCSHDFRDLGILDREMSQTNLSRTRQAGTVRGLHLLRPPARESKLVTCVTGSIWDVAVDLRVGSPTRHHAFGIEISAVQNIAIFLPPGVAHGFQSLEPDTTLIYQHSDDYRPELDTGVNACDPALGITWPLDVTARSMRDAALPLLANLDGSWGYPE